MLSGALLIDKPAGLTSHDVVAHVRKITGQKKVGHTGTLDPFATGLLIVALGPATRLIEYTHSLPKTYRAAFTLGAHSTTDDLTGQIAPSESKTKPSHQELLELLPTFLGPQAQTPPAFSAVKVKGRRAYQLARAGERATLTPRTITIHQLKLIKYSYPFLHLQITCSTGTYIRSLARDLSQKLGTDAFVSQLRRTQIGMFHSKQSLPLSELSTTSLSSAFLSPHTLLSHLPSLTLSPANVAKFVKGQVTNSKTPAIAPNTPLLVLDPAQRLLGIGTYHPSSHLLSPTKVLI
jgi:tRNA pseudouridine55 synthase